MKATTIVVCVLVAGMFVCFGFWWKANVEAPQTDTQSARPPHTYNILYIGKCLK